MYSHSRTAIDFIVDSSKSQTETVDHEWAGVVIIVALLLCKNHGQC